MALLRGPDAAAAESMSDLLARNPGYGGSIASMLATRPDAQKLHYAFVLRNATVGWTLDLRKEYFAFLRRAHEWNGGASFQGFLNNIDNDAFENATDSERLAIEATGARAAFKAPELPKPHGPGRAWSKNEILALAGARAQIGAKLRERQAHVRRGPVRGLPPVRRRRRRDRARPDSGRRPLRCQRPGRGDRRAQPRRLRPVPGVGHRHRFRPDRHRPGRQRICATRLIVVTDPEDSSKVVEIPRKSIEAVKPSTVSLMPEKLLAPLNEQEVLDLLAYLLSRGDSTDAMFRRR